MKIVPVPVRDDNYAYLVIDDMASGPLSAAFVDPFDVKKLQAEAEKQGIKEIIACITTHHHADHSGGNNDFAKAYPGKPIWGGSHQIPKLTKQVGHLDSFPLREGSSIQVTGHATPCHTQDSVCFFLEDKADGNKKGVFTGDTLFISGCGRFFEGTAEEMHKALNKTLAALPDDTVIYCGHEYTKSNVAFSAAVLPHRPAVKSLVQDLQKSRNSNVTTGVYTIGDEKKHNVFMLVDDEEVRSKVGGKDSIDTMAKLREAKNNGSLKASI
ncbi:Metallo-hydrolase/oxidoreductase [Tilletiaria anomala UBC 951]|uniref:hydroxyacylglutathione hydrolase n=1 Tax=Tilletiaria anomala (strain ATCC 24038 / CBS 436.72 / UBC 951) TaxID=1037660 RepID=A0A066WFY7_TILAU|nr:Metallo-hydrolase/oxidoreductase [Tilletiaria anomala UBC 951]KDN51433.1 Metallo-hydrolase/oxidoreductase [Tilletiaria anomala UBC 951]